MQIDSAEFAVLDFETTGLFPGRHDRVIEVGLVRVDVRGRILDTYTTLVQPNRDLGPVSVHGIRGRDVESAPSFEEIVGDVLCRLEGSVLVGHNSAFDAAFLEAECARLEIALPTLPRLCTLCLGYQLGIAPPRRALSDACRHFGIAVDDLHSALDDARASALLLAMYLEHARSKGFITLSDLGCATEPNAEGSWPRREVHAVALPRAAALRRPSASTTYLAGLISRLPATAPTDDTAQTLAPYLEVLDRVLEDRRITEGEASALEQLALDLGLSAEQVREAHSTYLDNLAALALADGNVSELERRDLDDAAVLLGLGTSQVGDALDRPKNAAAPSAPKESLAGKTVCFTGALRCRIKGETVTREAAERLAEAAGLKVLSGVSKKLDLLVVADPDTLSGKAKKARECGTRILADAVFFRMIGAQID